MKRYAIILSALMVPGFAFAGEHGDMKQDTEKSSSWDEKKADEYGEKSAEYEEKAQEYGTEAQHAAAAAHATQQIQGEVERVDLAKGELRVKTSGEKSEKLTLRGTPDQIRQYEKGQQVNVDVRKFGDNHWLTSKATAPAAGAKSLTARVAKVDSDKGEIELSDAKPNKLSANPQDLEQIQPGQQVSVTYEEVDGKNWVSSISEQGQQGQQGQQEGFEGQQEGQQQQPGMEGMDEPDPMME